MAEYIIGALIARVGVLIPLMYVNNYKRIEIRLKFRNMGLQVALQLFPSILVRNLPLLKVSITRS